jgi:hypothetical protein
MRTLNPHNSPVSPGVRGLRVFAPLALLAAALCGAMLHAQTPATVVQPAKPHKAKAAHPHKRLVATPALAPATPAAPTPATPLAPELPQWPANEKPVPAAITWDSQGLLIDAANSSLEEILMEVATLTGAKLEGFDADQRVFGAFGPGPARDVLSQLLLGSGYNVQQPQPQNPPPIRPGFPPGGRTPQQMQEMQRQQQMQQMHPQPGQPQQPSTPQN